jgi:hypothetical protein
MRFLFGRGWVFCDETNGTDANGAAGGAAAVDDGDAGATTEGAPKDMKSAIDAALGYKKGPNGEALDPLTGKAKEEQKPAQLRDQPPVKETETHMPTARRRRTRRARARR